MVCAVSGVWVGVWDPVVMEVLWVRGWRCGECSVGVSVALGVSVGISVVGVLRR